MVVSVDADQRAYAYLLHPADRVLSEEAYERLKAIGEFTDLGSGFKLAMRDLEIRGAGNLLGGAQSGHIAAVGFDLYCELVTEAVGELKGEPRVEELEVVIDIPVDAHLPREYVSRDDVRMEAYRRLAAVTTQADVDDVRTEWLDRYGPLPPAAEALLSVARLRAECVRVRRDERVGAEGDGADRGPRAAREPEGPAAAPRAPGHGQGGRRGRDSARGRRGSGLRLPPDAAAGAHSAGLRGRRARMIRVPAGRVPSSVKRPLVLLAATLVAALLLSACGSTTEPDAATVGKTSISRSQLDDELKVIAGNKALAKELKTQNIDLTPSSGGIAVAVTTGWLTSLVNQVFVDKVFNEKHLKVTAENKTAAKTAAEGIFINAKIFGQFPKSFQDTVIDRQERIEAVKSSLPKQSVRRPRPSCSSSSRARRHSSARAGRSSRTSSSRRRRRPTRSKRHSRRELTSRPSRPRSPRTPVPRPRGGLVACTDSQQFTQLAESFRNAAAATPVGSVSAPVQTEFGYHVIKVAPWDFATARPVIEEAYAQQQGQDNPLTAFLNQRLKSSKLWVDPRYGTVKRTAAGVAIAPPKTPKPKSRPTTTTTVAPTGQAPTGQAPTGQAPTGPGPDGPGLDQPAIDARAVTPGRVVAVGLGPAGVDLMLPSARSTISYMQHRYARTARHPAVDELAAHGLEFVTFDDRYDAADHFDDLYREHRRRVGRGGGRARLDLLRGTGQSGSGRADRHVAAGRRPSR